MSWGYYFSGKHKYVAERSMDNLCRGRPWKTAKSLLRFEYELMKLAAKRLLEYWRS